MQSTISRCLMTLVTFRFQLLMPAYMENDGVLCTKLVCFYKREEGSTLPAVQASVVLLDPEYGNVKAVSETNACIKDCDTLKYTAICRL